MTGEKRQRILDAAERIVSAKVRGAEITEIYAASGVAESALYHIAKIKRTCCSLSHKSILGALFVCCNGSV